ncbi:hypothetical protein PV05_11735 [Exophiala xenobiotica]|uniref:VOC domain-containing protein n=1 Tax=Exophiala xenobiotica TaxID=348802 RepID=A0A0D2CJW0_9EURO|nr:uncharacterized protein PV05_11735 [Exophiala xenobiotica]KIW50117.1 hypothetical protein PV05_11735 [Exophiala xenobiotica]
MSPVDHVSLPCHFSKVGAEVAFLVAAFGHMGLKELIRFGPGVVGLGTDSPWLWVSGLHNSTREEVEDDVQISTVHLAVTAKDRGDVDAFHAAAVKAGGTDHGAPGVRAMYHPNYYGAFAISPAGHNIEAVTHEPA